MNRLKVEQVGHHLYEVKLNCGYETWEIVRVKAINEYVALFKALRGRFFMALFKIR